MRNRSHGTGSFRPEDFAACGEQCVFETGVLVFHPENIHLGNNVYVGHQTILTDRYLVVSVLCNGTMGAVYLADDQRLTGRRCAIKENRPGADESPDVLARLREQFLAEPNVLARLDHPGFPKVSDYFITDNRFKKYRQPYFIESYLEAISLINI